MREHACMCAYVCVCVHARACTYTFTQGNPSVLEVGSVRACMHTYACVCARACTFTHTGGVNLLFWGCPVRVAPADIRNKKKSERLSTSTIISRYYTRYKY